MSTVLSAYSALTAAAVGHPYLIAIGACLAGGVAMLFAGRKA
jgi:hypothetical protein